jgi:hypothetical protein
VILCVVAIGVFHLGLHDTCFTFNLRTYVTINLCCSEGVCKFRAVDTRPIIPQMTARLFGVLRYALRGVDLDLSLLEEETLIIVRG